MFSETVLLNGACSAALDGNRIRGCISINRNATDIRFAVCPSISIPVFFSERSRRCNSISISDVSLVGCLSDLLELSSKDRNQNRYQNTILS